MDERVPHDGNSMSSPGNLDKPNGVEDTQIFLPGVRITSDPTKYGNCQFDALARQLSSLGIHRSGDILRQSAVLCLRQNKDRFVDFFLEMTTIMKNILSTCRAQKHTVIISLFKQ